MNTAPGAGAGHACVGDSPPPHARPSLTRVLLIEDEQDYARLLEAWLASADGGGFAVEWAGTLERGLAHLNRNETDVVVLDLRLPDSREDETVRRVAGRAPHLPIVVLSGVDDERTMRQAVEQGAQEYLVKDDYARQLLPRAVRYAVERKRAETALRESEAKYRSLVESMSTGVIVCGALEGGADFIIKGFNRAAEEIEQASGKEVIGQRLTRALPGMEPCGILNAVRRVWRTARSESVPACFCRGSRTSGWRESHVYKLASGEVVLVYDDVTARRKAERELSVLQAELRSLSLRLVEAEERERRWLARELHDQIGAELSALGVNLTLLQGQLGRGGEPAAVKRLDDLIDQMEDITARVRDVMFRLRPHGLDEYGLGAGLRAHVDHLRQRTGLRTEIRGTLARRLPAETEMALFRICQEALNNVVKHADASRAVVTLAERPERIRLVIADDGKGFDPDAQRDGRETQHVGLIAMRERALGIGGVFRLESAPGHGTRVVVELPSPRDPPRMRDES